MQCNSLQETFASRIQSTHTQCVYLTFWFKVCKFFTLRAQQCKQVFHVVIRAGNFYSQLKCHLKRGKKEWQSRLPGSGRGKAAGNCKMRRMNEKIIVKANKSGRRREEGNATRSLISSQEHKMSVLPFLLLLLRFAIVIVVAQRQRSKAKWRRMRSREAHEQNAWW